VKLGFGTSMITPGLKKKIKIYKEAGVIPYFGGTLFEAFIVRDMFREFVKFLDKYKIELVEVSDGSYDIEHSRKLEYIKILSKRGTVISEVGSKKKEVVYSPDEWVEMMKSELDAGSIKVIAEARESGTTGIYNEDGSINNKIISSISEHVKLENVIWEAPMKAQQAWFISHFGANVNLGNIAPYEVISLETLRLGLRGDTFFQFLPGNQKGN
jgi:phosphosulfolactate synthase